MSLPDWANGYEKWSIQDFINIGISITQEAQEGDAIYRDQFIAVDVHSKFVTWRILLRDFLTREGYFNPESSLYYIAEPLLEADSVPMLKGGYNYGIPESSESQTLLRNMREETKDKLRILRELKSATKERETPELPSSYDPKTQILLFKGKAIQVAKRKDANPAKLAKIIFTNTKKSWQNDEILEVWFKGLNNFTEWESAVKAKSIYHAANKINAEIEKKTGVPDFFEVTTKSVRILPEHL